MHLAFVDIVYDYTVDRPDQDAPLGGTTSAICFLVRELKKTGIDCTLFNKIAAPQIVEGIEALPLDALIDERANPKYSAFIFCGRWVEWMVKSIRETSKAPLIAWMHESLMVAPLTAPLDLFDGVVFVSEWQKRTNQPYGRPHWRQIVLRNGMNPCFAGLFGKGEPILAAKTRPPVLLFAGATPRGAFHIPPLLERLRLRRTEFTMEIFCNVTPTNDAQANEAYIAWMRGLPNVTHVGMMGQKNLAQHMKRAAVLMSPNPWPETSCIAMMEAMAAGLCVITTDRAVLPETAEGFARHIAIEDADAPLRFDMPMPYEQFAAAIDETLSRWLEQPAAMERGLRTQIDHFHAHYQWADRAVPWLEFLRSFG